MTSPKKPANFYLLTNHERQEIIDQFREEFRRAVYRQKPWKEPVPADAFKRIAWEVQDAMVAVWRADYSDEYRHAAQLNLDHYRSLESPQANLDLEAELRSVA